MQLQPAIKHSGQILHSLSDNGCFSQLFFADPAYEPEFKHIEDNPGLTVTFVETACSRGGFEGEIQEVFSHPGWNFET